MLYLKCSVDMCVSPHTCACMVTCLCSRCPRPEAHKRDPELHPSGVTVSWRQTKETMSEHLRMEAPVSTDSLHSSFTQLTQRNLLDIDTSVLSMLSLECEKTTGNPKESRRLPQSQPYSVVLCGLHFSSPLLITDFTLLLKLVRSYMEDYQEDREQELSMMLLLVGTSLTPGLLSSTLHCPTVSAMMSYR